jgi:hypothetical protein
LQHRYAGSADLFKKYNYFTKHNDNEIKELLGYDKNKKNIFLFTNIYWDVGPQNAKLYDGVIQWVLSTIGYLKNNNSIHLYIKPHPGEKLDDAKSLKGIAEIIREHYPVLPKNLSIIEPELRLNTYKLLNLIDLGVVYSGTIGIEMLVNNIPTINVGITPYSNLGIGIEPSSKEEYVSLLECTSSDHLLDLDEIKLFSYFYFIKSKIPWTLTKKAWGDDFSGFMYRLTNIAPGQDLMLDHICDCIMNKTSSFESWPGS